MRGTVEESAEVTAMRELKRAARRYASEYLLVTFDGGSTDSNLHESALAYARAMGLVSPRSKKTTKTKT